MKYKIDFKRSFFLCVFIMSVSQIWGFLKERPEAFPYGNEVYHTIEVIFYILSNLSIGIAAAIVFYFMALFLDKKKNLGSYDDLRADIKWLLCSHMTILSELKQFEELNKRERIGDLFYSVDVPILIKTFKSINSKEQKTQFKESLTKYFSNMSNLRLLFIEVDFEEYITRLDSKKNTRYFKGSKDLIESITSTYDEFAARLSYYKTAKVKNVEDEQAFALKYLVEECYLILESTVKLYEELEMFIETIEKRKILEFIKMVD